MVEKAEMRSSFRGKSYSLSRSAHISNPILLGLGLGLGLGELNGSSLEC